jgi:hypothetical protein
MLVPDASKGAYYADSELPGSFAPGACEAFLFFSFLETNGKALLTLDMDAARQKQSLLATRINRMAQNVLQIVCVGQCRLLIVIWTCSQQLQT